MDRYYISGAIVDPPSAADVTSHGHPTDGDPSGSVPATQPGAYTWHMVMEEIMGAIEGAGLVADKTDLGQLAAAIPILAASGIVSTGRIFPDNDHISYGAAVRAQTFFQIAGAFAPADGGVYVAGFGFVPSLTGTPGDDLYGTYIAPTLVEAGSGTHALLAGAYFATPTVTAGAATVTVGATVYIQGACAPAGATAYSLYVAAGASRFGGTVQTDDEIICSANKGMRRNTSDGTDNGHVVISGGGAAEDVTRGAYLYCGGNEHATIPGYVSARLGNVSGAVFDVRGGDGTVLMSVTGSTGSSTFASTGGQGAWTFNSTATNGGSIAVKENGTIICHVGTYKSATGTGTVTDCLIYNPAAALYLAPANTASLGVFMDVSNRFAPAADNSISCGSSGQRWTAVWAVNGTIQTSDLRAKDIVGDSRGLDFVLKLKPIAYQWKTKKGATKDNRTYHGFGAQHVAELAPEMIHGNDEDGIGLNYSEFVAPTVKAIQELHARIVALEGRNH